MLKIKDNLKNQLLLASCVNRISLFGALCALLSAVHAIVFELDSFIIFFFILNYVANICEKTLSYGFRQSPLS